MDRGRILWTLFALLTLTCPAWARWAEQAQTTPTTITADDRLGWSAALSGETGVLGAPGDKAGAGAVWTIQRNGASWAWGSALSASDGDDGDGFGSAVSIWGDYCVIGAPNDEALGSYAGSAYLFERSGDAWTQVDKLLADDGRSFDYFGSAVSVWGTTAMVGATGDDDLGSASGSVYVFGRGETGWTQQAKLSAGDGSSFDNFGSAIAMCDSRAVIGAYRDNAADGTSDTGSVYVFADDGAGWSQLAHLTADDADEADRFGTSVATWGDWIAVGAPGNDEGAVGAGAVYLFHNDGTGWAQHSKLTAGDAGGEDGFGGSVALCEQGLLVGSAGDDDRGSGSGAVYAFAFDDDAWAQQVKFRPTSLGIGDQFGLAVAADGRHALAGAWSSDSVKTDAGLVVALFDAVKGDANCDERVDDADYTLWADNYNRHAGWAGGDFNGDGYVDDADYTCWADGYGYDATSTAAQTTVTPEPASIALLVAGLLLMLAFGNRRRGWVTR